MSRPLFGFTGMPYTIQFIEDLSVLCEKTYITK